MWEALNDFPFGDEMILHISAFGGSHDLKEPPVSACLSQNGYLAITTPAIRHLTPPNSRSLKRLLELRSSRPPHCVSTGQVHHQVGRVVVRGDPVGDPHLRPAAALRRAR